MSNEELAKEVAIAYEENSTINDVINAITREHPDTDIETIKGMWYAIYFYRIYGMVK